jgi:cell division protein FtsW (lipid II flippase)
LRVGDESIGNDWISMILGSKYGIVVGVRVCACYFCLICKQINLTKDG